MATELGRRERKKQQTRQLIFETASRLFAESGFDAVTIAEVARAADVSEVTVFNHFGTKEELFFHGMEIFEERLLDAVRERPPGESPLVVFRRLLFDGFDLLATEGRAEVIARAARLINASTTLQAREREIAARCTRSLAELLAAAGAETPDVEAWTVACALIGINRALVAYVRARALAGRRGRQLAADARSQAARAFARLEAGIADYAVKGA